MAAYLDTLHELPDGRRLAYTEWGDPHGRPVIMFHGSPLSRLWCPDEAATKAAGVRLIAPDRPGVGGSDVLEARTLGDAAPDVASLADGLGLGRFAVVGLSSGGGWAAACAALIPSRLTAVAIVSSHALADANMAEWPGAYEALDPDDRAEFDLTRKDPVAAGDLVATRQAEWAAAIQERPESIIDLAQWPECDHWFFNDGSRTPDFYASVREFFRQGIEGCRWEFLDAWRPWGFRLDEIPVHVQVWHGEQDTRVTAAQAEFVSNQIPDAVLTTWPDAGHMGMAKHWDQVLAALV